MISGLIRAVALALSACALLQTTAVAAPRIVNDPTYLSRYFPTHGWVDVDRDAAKSRSYFDMMMYWATPARRSALDTGQGDLQRYGGAYEHETVFENELANQCWPGPYHDEWESNLPAAYQDTAFDDNEGPNSVYFSRAGGTSNSAAVLTASWYYFFSFLDRDCTEPYVDVKVKAQDSHIGDGVHVFGCISGWQYCVFADPGNPRDVVPYSAGFQSHELNSWAYQQLANPSFDTTPGSSGWFIQPTTTASTATTHQSATGSAYEAPGYARVYCGGVAGCAVLTDRSFTTLASDIFNVEFAVRCPSGQPDCPIQIRLTGMGVTTTEASAVNYVVPADGGWYLAKFGVAGFNQHSSLRVHVYNNHATNLLDLDFGTLHWTDTAP